MMKINNYKKYISLYIHIPFCERKCSYCNFLSFALMDNDKCRDYISLILDDISSKKKFFDENRYIVKTIYIGGGTPSVIESEYIVKIINKIKESFILDEDIEVSIEANPSSIDEKKLFDYIKAGINRISIGVQSFNDDELKYLGRIHNSRQAVKSIKLCKKAGFQNINLDLMFDIPLQNIYSYQYSLEKAIESGVTHISTYSLQIEEGSNFYEQYKKSDISIMSNDEIIELYKMTQDILKKAGYDRYEISNFAKKGSESKHNLTYWNYKDYLSFGIGGASFLKGKRFENPRSIDGYSKYIQKDFLDFLNKIEKLPKRDEMGIFVFTALRKEKGIVLQKFKEIFGCDFYDVFSECKNFLEVELSKGNIAYLDNDKNKGFKLTDKGIIVSNDIMCEFV